MEPFWSRVTANGSDARSKPYKLRDRDSMYLRVSVSGSKVWKFDYRLDGKAAATRSADSPIFR
ncbi:Arm DNA-binding domain-containing protein [Paraburkholderia sp. BR13444]|uniref:Arm DNA-binding domain-containing protein n=1 Tax=Paraburkholderia sp. BR13444 TaxID=3236997 RepID=UPI0034CE840A